jgi:predicted metal-dependent phosphoesterase TrpH
MIDLHTHTTASDGTLPPTQLVKEALRVGIEVLGITDHDTLEGYDRAIAHARQARLPLVPGVELSTKYQGRSVHLLAYFIHCPPPPEFRRWLAVQQTSRRDRNQRLIASLQAHGIDITLEEVQAIGEKMTGRPHFAQVLLQKGRVATLPEAFDRYLGETAETYVDRIEPQLDEAIAVVNKSGGLPVLAHPIRVAAAGEAECLRIIGNMAGFGLRGIEVYYSDHDAKATTLYLGIAGRLNLAVTGGSDFHGATKPGISLGTGRNSNLNIDKAVFAALKLRL